MRLWHKFTGIVAIASLLLVACSSEHSEPPKLTKTVQSDQPEEGQTITVINPEVSEKNSGIAAPVLNIRNKYQIQTRLTDFQLLSTTTGLAWGCTRNELRLYITRDNGKTWTNISPAASVQFPSTPEYGKDIFFIDPMHGWIVRSAAGSADAIVLRTKDGGETWKVASFAGDGTVSAMYFANRDQGWILTDSNAKDYDNNNKILLETANGGASWSPMMNNQQLPGSGRPAPILPDLGLVTSMTFSDEQNGFVTMIKAGFPVLLETDNGGKKWTENTDFFNVNKYNRCSAFTVGDIDFFPYDHKTGWVPVGCQRGSSAKFNGYFTEDFGNSWTLVPFNLSWQTGINEYMPPTFLNAKEGWTILNSTVFHTIDQGKKWKPLPKSKKLAEIMRDYPQILKLRFFSSKVGWLLVSQKEQSRSLLLQTRDGGISWQVL